MVKKSKVNICVDPLKSGTIKSNINRKIMKFITSLSYDGFVLAGNAVANMIKNIDIQGDLDFWVTDKNKYLNVLNEFENKKPERYDIYPSMILLEYPDLPEVNLILSD